MKTYGKKMPTKNKLIFLLCLLMLSGANTLCSAQNNIQKYEERKNVKKLILVLENEELSKSDRKQAAWALGRLKDTQALDPLTEALKDDDLRIASVWALGEIGGEKASEALVRVLTDEFSPEKEEAVKALNRLGWKPANDREESYYLVALRDWDKCMDLGEIAIEPLVFTLKNGHENARIGAKATLDSLGWMPGEKHMEAYAAAKKLEVEFMAFRELIIQDEMKLIQEFESNYQKLKEDQQAGHLDLTDEEFRSLEQRFTKDIMQEQSEIDTYRTAIYEIQLKTTRIGDKVYLGIENPKSQGVSIFKIIRDPNKSQVSSVWFNQWTGNPTKEFEWDPQAPESGNFYRYTSQGDKYLFARYYFNDPGERRIDLMERDGSVKERIVLGPECTFSTRIHEDNWEKWMEWPQEISFADERLKLLETDLITSGGRLFGR